MQKLSGPRYINDENLKSNQIPMGKNSEKNLSFSERVWDLVKRVFCLGKPEGSLDRIKIFDCFELPRFWSGKRIVKITPLAKKDSAADGLPPGANSKKVSPAAEQVPPAADSKEVPPMDEQALPAADSEEVSPADEQVPPAADSKEVPPMDEQALPAADSEEVPPTDEQVPPAADSKEVPPAVKDLTSVPTTTRVASQVEIASSTVLAKSEGCFLSQVSEKWKVRDPREPREKPFTTPGKKPENRLLVNAQSALEQQKGEDGKAKGVEERRAEIDDFLKTFDPDSVFEFSAYVFVEKRGYVEVMRTINTVYENGSAVLELQGYPYGVTFTQGKRNEMEDNHAAFTVGGCPCFAIFDGHGGSLSANYCAEKMQQVLTRYLEENGKESLQELTSDDELILFFKKSFILLDEEIKAQHPWNGAGTTVALNVIIDNRIICVNLGDSRTVIIDQNDSAVQISKDMECGDKKYTKKAEEKGFIPYWDNMGEIYRLEGLAVPRTIGYGSEAFSPVPTLSACSIGKLMIIACDGLWDVVTPLEAGELVVQMRNSGYKEGAISRALVQWAIIRRSTDNISVMIVNTSEIK